MIIRFKHFHDSLSFVVIVAPGRECPSDECAGFLFTFTA